MSFCIITTPELEVILYRPLGKCLIMSLIFSVYQEAIFRTLAAILHLGNVEFSPGKEHDSSIIKDAKSNFHLQMAAELSMLVTYSSIFK